MRPEIKIIVATNKKIRVPKDNIYIPVHVGAETSLSDKGDPLDLGYVKDNEGENISSLNWCFGTQTAVYWAWKNLTTDYIGLVHYRRYFVSKKSKKNEDAFRYILSENQVRLLMDQYRVVLPKKRHYYIESVYSHYKLTMKGGEQQLGIVRDIIECKNTQYKAAFERVMRRKSAYLFNMMIMEKKLFDEYCNWLFPILFELFDRFDIDGLNSFERRYAGRISERLLNVWIEYKIETGELKKDDIKEALFTENVNWTSKIIAFIKAKTLNKKYDKSF